jgi:secreted trypsin-like serine protease
MYLAPCEGDSGGPIVDSTVGILMGTVSLGSPICGYAGCPEPKVYSNIANLRVYIDGNTGQSKASLISTLRFD